MVTKEQALNCDMFHYTGKEECKRVVGPRGGITVYVVQCRRSGKTQTWKTRPDEFRVPVMHGLYSHGELTNRNAEQWHTAKDCPLLKEK